ncbi:MAG: homoserine kinase [Acidobacteria bacterium]|nr:MAG: homoserine kinase [Acidobacteriota bacterium]
MPLTTKAMPQRGSVRVPATSANLGCAFDCAALALNLYLDIHVTRRSDLGVSVHYKGVNPDRIPSDESNLIAASIKKILLRWGKDYGFNLEINNQIPVGVGLGSSAAAIVGAIAAAHWLTERALYDDELVSLATEIEGHPDNVAAAWHGGFTVAMQENQHVWSYSSPVPDLFHVVLVIPDYALPTEKARAVLPPQYLRADVTHNIQRAAVLAAQMFSGKVDFHPDLFDDRLHQPYRAGLVPGLKEVLTMRHSSLYGLCLSGAGPSILAFTKGSSPEVGEAICQVLREKGVESSYSVLVPDNRGAKGWSLPV